METERREKAELCPSVPSLSLVSREQEAQKLGLTLILIFDLIFSKVKGKKASARTCWTVLV